MVRRWNEVDIATEILRLNAAGEDLSYGAAQKNHLNLLRAATRYFGSWKAAVEHVGLKYEEIRRYKVWSAEAIVAKIREYHKQGEDLSWRHVSLELDPALAAAAIRSSRFGSWKKALEAAGLDYRKIRRHRSWDKPAIVREVRQRHARGASLRAADVCEEQPDLVAAARRRFDGWYEAVAAAGLDHREARGGPHSLAAGGLSERRTA